MKFKRFLALVLAVGMIVSNDGFTALAEESVVAETGNSVAEETVPEDATADLAENGTPVDAGEDIDSLDDATDEIAVEEAEVNGEDEIDLSGLCGYMEIEGQEDFPALEETDDGGLELNGDSQTDKYFCSDGNHNIVLPDYMPSLRYQYNGTCWAHASMALAEISMIKQGYMSASSADLSELQLAYFTYNTVVDPLGGIEGDSNSWISDSDAEVLSDRGGNLSFAENVLASWTGAVNESLANESSATDKAKIDVDGFDSDLAYNNDIAVLKNYYNVNIKENPEAVKALIIKNGAVGAAFHVKTSGFDDVYNSENNCYYDNSYSSTNHAITIIGWDDSYPASYFNSSKQPSGNGAWLIRNSWSSGTDESLYGYFWLSYYDTSIEADAYSFEFTKADEYDHNYQYDGGMQSSGWGFSSGTAKFANVFTAKGNDDGSEVLKAVSFDTYQATNVNYEINIYKFSSGSETYKNNPEGGSLVTTLTGETTYAGYYTVPLSDSIVLNNGDIFSVVVKVTKNSGTVYVPCETSLNASWYSIAVSAKQYQSFYYNGYSWYDLGANNGENIRVKAFTCDYDSDEPLKSFSVDAPTYVLKDGTSKLSITTDPTGKSSDLTYSSADESIATVSENGYVTGKAIGTTTITVSATIEGETVSKTATVYVADISISGDSSITLGNGTKQYTYTKNMPSALSGETFTWSTSDTDIATIDTEGNLTAKAVGTVDVILSSTHYQLKKSVSISIEKFKPDYTIDKTGKMTFSWNKIAGAVRYEIWYSTGYNDIKSLCTIDQNEDSYSYDFIGKVGKSISSVNFYYYLYYTSGSQTEYIRTIDYVYVGKANSITYMNMENATNNEENKDYVLADVGMQALYNPNRTGYTFDGWYEDEECSGDQIKYVSGIYAKDYVVYAKWVPITYTLKYWNGSSEYTTTTPCTYDVDVTLINNPFDKGSKTFACWNTKSDKSGISYNAGQVVRNLTSTSGDTVNLYAIWDETKYQITYDLGDGVTNDARNPIIYLASGNTGTIYDPSKTGYTFDSWTSDDSNFTVTNGTYSVADSSKAKDVTLTPSWTANTYTLSFSYDGSSVGTSKELSYDEEYTLPSMSLLNSDRKLICWNTKEDGSGTSYQAGEKVKNLTSENGGAVTLYAITAKETITVTLKYNDGSGNTQTLSVKYGQAYGTLPAITRTDYTFDGWYTDKNDGTKVEETDIVTETDDFTLYAHWTRESTVINCAAPTSNITTGSMVDSGTIVMLTTTTEYADIYYTTDGTTPTTSSSLYSSQHPIKITADTTIKAFTSGAYSYYDAVYRDSDVVTFTYKVRVDQGDVLDKDWNQYNSGNADKLWYTTIANQTYTGKVITPEFRVYYGKKLLKKGSDYTVANSEKGKLVNAGDYKLKVTGKGNYSGSTIENIPFTIDKVDISSDLNAILDYSVAYDDTKNKNGIKPSFVVKAGTKKLKLGTDYTITSADGKCDSDLSCKMSGENPEVFKFTITAIGNYSGTVTKTMTLKKSLLNLSAAKITVAKKVSYKDYWDDTTKTFAATPEVKVTYKGKELTASTYEKTNDYKLYYSNNTLAGTATVTIAADGNDYVGSKTAAFKIEGISLSSYKVVFYDKDTESAVTSCTYSYDKPNVNVGVKVVNKKDASDVLTEDVDYTVTWPTTYSKGNYKVTVTGTNRYSGKLTGTLKITQFDFTNLVNNNRDIYSDSGVLLADDISIYYDESVAYTVNGAKPSVKVLFGGTTLKLGTDYKLTYKNNNKVGSSAKYTITGIGNFKGNFAVQYEVKAKDISDANNENSTISMMAVDKVATGKAGSGYSAPVITDSDSSNAKLKAGRDYTVEYYYSKDGEVRNVKVEKKDIIDAQTVTEIAAVATGIGGYTGTATYIYHVMPKNFTVTAVKIKLKDKVYTGDAIEITSADIDYDNSTIKFIGEDNATELSEEIFKKYFEILPNTYKNNVKKGTATVTVKGKYDATTGKSYCGTVTVKFKITARSLTE